jgi:GT2 family glycosyltransferase
MTRCYMLRDNPVNTTSAQWISVRRTAAIGDSLSATVVADKLIERGYSVSWHTHSSIQCVIRRHPRIQDIREPGGPCDINLDGAYEKHPSRARLHFSTMWLEKANSDLARLGINLGPALNCKPTLRLHPNERLAGQAKFKEYPRPWVFVCPRSDAYACRQVPDGIWSDAAKNMHGTKFWLGRHPAPPHFVDLKCQHFDNVIVWLSAADLLVTVDTGPMHVGGALGIPILALGQSSSPELHLSDQVDFLTINCQGLNCLNCQKNVCPIAGRSTNPPCESFNPDYIAQWTNAKLRQLADKRISAVVPIYQPEASVLNRCLESILPQVDEVIVTEEGGNSRLPKGAMQSPKIRYVVKGLKGIGYARNCNFGARYTTGSHILFLNDDAFMNPGSVEKMMDVCKPGVGAVAGKLFYPDGTIYHAGKFRTPGSRGWGHIDLRAREGSIKEPVECENVNGAAILIPRNAFYTIGGMDEEFFGYCSDDDTCMKLRRAGYKIIYQPHASGIHYEGQSMKKIEAHRGDLIRNGCLMFERKWKDWWDRNLQTVPGNNW